MIAEGGAWATLSVGFSPQTTITPPTIDPDDDHPTEDGPMPENEQAFATARASQVPGGKSWTRERFAG